MSDYQKQEHPDIYRRLLMATLAAGDSVHVGGKTVTRYFTAMPILARLTAK